MRSFTRFVLLIWIFACFGQARAQSSGIASLLDLVNQARIAKSVPPLAASTVLTAIAQAHSSDMAQTQKLSHSGSNGSEFWQRMQTGGYALTTGAENILVRSDTDAQAAFDQWKGSPAHLANMLNSSYHEIGIAYAQAANGSYYYTMVLGARADSQALPLPSPTIVASPTPTAVALSATPAPLDATALLPSPTLIATSSIQVTPMDQSTNAAPPASATPVVTRKGIAQILLTYNADSVTLLNIAPNALNVSKLVFTSKGGTFRATRWKDYGATALDALRPGDCLQVWTTETTKFPEKPAACQTRQAWLATGPAGQFWRGDGTFTVQQDNEDIARCPIVAGTCRLTLNSSEPSDTQAPLPTPVPSTPIASGEADLRLIVEASGVTLINVSEQNTDLSHLTFVGDKGTFAADRWQTAALSRPLDRFPSGDCVQMWVYGENAEPIKAPECGHRHGWLLVTQKEQFWLGSPSFTVLNNGVSVGTCTTETRVCDIALP